jgi:type 1 glutamine amidotransferase
MTRPAIPAPATLPCPAIKAGTSAEPRPAASPRPRPTALVVITGDDVYEDLFTASLKLQDLLAGLGFTTRAVMGTGRLAALANGSATSSDSKMRRAAAGLAGTDLIVLYTATGQFAPGTQAALAGLVSAGTGLIAIHAANVFPSIAGRLDESYRELFELIGSRYASHGPRPHESRFTVHADQNHPVTSGLAPFEIDQEHYQLNLAPDSAVVAWRDTPAGREPVLHVREHGAGRVAYLQLGHDMRAWDDPAVRGLLARCAAWARRDRDDEPGSAGDHHALHNTGRLHDTSRPSGATAPQPAGESR